MNTSGFCVGNPPQTKGTIFPLHFCFKTVETKGVFLSARIEPWKERDILKEVLEGSHFYPNGTQKAQGKNQ